MSIDRELEHWRYKWHSPAATPNTGDLLGRLQEQVRRETRRMKIALVGPVLVTIIAGGGTVLTAVTLRRPADIALATGIWGFIVLVWAGALWIARGTRQPIAETTDAFLRVSIRRCQSTLTAIKFGAALYLAGFAAALAWQHAYLYSDTYALLTSWPVLLLGVVGIPVLFLILHALTKRKRAELECLLELERQLGEGAADG